MTLIKVLPKLAPIARSFHRAGGPSAAGVPLLFRSDWDGRSVGSAADIDVLDGSPGKWSENGGASAQKHVRDAAGQGLPSGMGRYLEIEISYESSSYVDVQNLPVLPNAGSRFWRFYTKLHLGSAVNFPLSSSPHHPVEQYHGSCPFKWEMKWGADSFGGTGDFNTIVGSQEFRYQDHTGSGTPHLFLLDTWYRIEYGFLNKNSGANTCGFGMRIYDVAGTLLADGGNGHHLIETSSGTYLDAAAPTMSLAVDDPPGEGFSQCETRMTYGTNGPGPDTTGWGSTPGTGSYQAFAGVACSDVGWIGPWAPGY